MNSILEYIGIAIFVAVVLFVTYYVTDYGSRRRVAKDFRDPEDIIEAAGIYANYGRTKAALELIDGGLERHPGHAGLEQKRAEILAAKSPKD